MAALFFVWYRVCCLVLVSIHVRSQYGYDFRRLQLPLQSQHAASIQGHLEGYAPDRVRGKETHIVPVDSGAKLQSIAHLSLA